MAEIYRDYRRNVTPTRKLNAVSDDREEKQTKRYTAPHGVHSVSKDAAHIL